VRYEADVIDTWEMTITPVDGEFVTKKKDDYHLIDAKGRAIALPGKPGMAIRLIRVGDDG
jgi:hypothetical protein